MNESHRFGLPEDSDSPPPGRRDLQSLQNSHSLVPTVPLGSPPLVARPPGCQSYKLHIRSLKIRHSVVVSATLPEAFSVGAGADWLFRSEAPFRWRGICFRWWLSLGPSLPSVRHSSRHDSDFRAHIFQGWNMRLPRRRVRPDSALSYCQAIVVAALVLVPAAPSLLAQESASGRSRVTPSGTGTTSRPSTRPATGTTPRPAAGSTAAGNPAPEQRERPEGQVLKVEPLPP